MHPAQDFLDTVKNAASLVALPQIDVQGNVSATNEIADQDLWEFLAQSNAEWGNLLPTQDFSVFPGWP